MKQIYYILFLAGLLSSCSNGSEENKRLPFLGRFEVVTNEEGGKKVVDTIHHQIPQFNFLNQDSAMVNNATMEGHIYVSDFFFTSCLTICPTMKGQMLRVYDSLEANNLNDVLFLSHTIDPAYDTVPLLHEYANRLGVSSQKWHFVTGDKKAIYAIAKNGYLATAVEDSTVQDGFIHSGAFLLIDKKGHIRGRYDGTKPEDVNVLIQDIKKLNQTYEK